MKAVVQETGPIFYGQEREIVCPSGRVLTIRETNGEDDEILSRLSDANTGDNVYKFLASITLMDSFLKKKPLFKDVQQWPSNDKFGLLFKQRLINHGDILNFETTCPNDRCVDHLGNRTKTPYQEDLKKAFDDDLANPQYDGTSPKNRLSLYKYGDAKEHVFTISSGKTLRYKILTGELEKMQLAMPLDATTRNTKLIIRELSLMLKNEWVLLTTFHALSSREMSEVRSEIDKGDTTFDPEVEVTCPKCKLQYTIPLFSIPTFYFPEPMM